MEEILASIRRIIAEDGEAPGEKSDGKAEATLPSDAAPVEDVLELTDVVEEEERTPPNPPPALVPRAEEPVLALPPDPPTLRAVPPDEGERLLSAESKAASVAALTQLVARGQRDRGELPLGNVDRTLEDLVRELLRPLLKTWLDENLPPLVERLVREELARIAHEAQGR